MSASNRVGHPVRNRKRNRLIYNEDEETSFGPQNRFQLYTAPTPPPPSTSATSSASLGSKSLKTSTTQVATSSGTLSRSPSDYHHSHPQYHHHHLSPSVKNNKFNKNIGTALTSSLKTLLKLPKAHNWVNHEWFYGNIDQVLFLDENEFSICLRDSFPQLKTRFLTRMEWSQIRRLMGKPRRCSSSFFEEERSTLNAKRSKIRYLQQNKVTDLKPYKDLPDNIPHPLVVGTQVGALARVFDSLYFGVIEGIDTANGTYRVSFNRPDIGSLSIPDYEVASIEMPVMAPLSSFELKPRKIWHISNRFVENSPDANSSQQQHLQCEKSFATYKVTNDVYPDANIGGFPIKFLIQLVKASKILTLKRKKIGELKAMNAEIERMTTLSEPISYSFKKNYSLNILELEKINKDIHNYLTRMQSYSLQSVASEGKLKSLKPDVVSQKCLLDSRNLIERLQTKFKVSEKPHNLITYLMSLMFHLRGFRDSEVSSYEFQSITDTIAQIKKQIKRPNMEAFQNNVEIHMRHIMSSVSHLGNVGVFSEPNSNNSAMTTDFIKLEI